MLQSWKKLAAGALAPVILAACLAGCVSDDNPDPTTDPTQTTAQETTQETTQATTQETTQDTEPSVPETEPNTMESTVQTESQSQIPAEPEQLRLNGYNADWVDRFAGEFGAFKLVNDTEQLDDVLSAIAGMGKNVTLPEKYNEAFFEQYRLVLIPRQTGSGSVRYEAQTSFNGELITITLTAKMPEFGTADMADWLVLVPLDRDAYPEGVQIDLLANQSPVGTVDPDIKIS